MFSERRRLVPSLSKHINPITVWAENKKKPEEAKVKGKALVPNLAIGKISETKLPWGLLSKRSVIDKRTLSSQPQRSNTVKSTAKQRAYLRLFMRKRKHRGMGADASLADDANPSSRRNSRQKRAR